MSKKFLVSVGDVYANGDYEEFMLVIGVPVGTSLNMKDTFELDSDEYFRVFGNNNDVVYR